MSARPGVSPAVTPEKRGSAAAVPPPRRVQNSCYENLIDGMCCQLPGKISRSPLTKRKNGKEQGSSERPGCAGSGASAGSRKKDPHGTGNSQAGARLRSARRDAPWPLAHRRKCRRPEGSGRHTRASPEAGRKDTGGARQKEGQYGKPGGLVFIRQAQGRRKGSLSIRGNSWGLPPVARRKDRQSLEKLAAPGG